MRVDSFARARDAQSKINAARKGDDDELTPFEAGARAGVSYEGILHAWRRGDLRHASHGHGGHPLFLAEDVDAWARSRMLIF